tara:strand:- start:254 stop:418 length:165 start_codon:yes stop_codon:yes gene_type:complete
VRIVIDMNLSPEWELIFDNDYQAPNTKVKIVFNRPFTPQTSPFTLHPSPLGMPL